MTDKEQIDDLTRQIQKECHELAWAVKDKSPETFAMLENQDVTNVFLFKKLAEIEYRLQKLEAKNN